MLRWLGSIFQGQRAPRDQRSHNEEDVTTASLVARRKLVLDDAKSIEDALIKLGKVGLKFRPGVKESLQDAAAEIAAQWEGISFSGEPTPGHWALIALSREFQAFENAIFFQDHCFDGIASEDFSRMVAEIVRLAGNDWPFEYVEVQDARRPQDPLQYMQPVTVTIHATPEVTPFNLINAKDFDWSLVLQLNERLPQGVRGRFWIFLDGNATIVFLTPEDVRRLNALCGYEFFNEESATAQRKRGNDSH